MLKSVMADVVVVFGSRLDVKVKDLESLVKRFIPTVPQEYTNFEEWMDDALCNGIKLFKDKSYELQSFNYDTISCQPTVFLVLKVVVMSHYHGQSGIQEFDLPSKEDVDDFCKTIGQHGLGKYSQYVLLEQ
jgi:hypothetical protein